jgi:hypothetical protein
VATFLFELSPRSGAQRYTCDFNPVHVVDASRIDHAQSISIVPPEDSWIDGLDVIRATLDTLVELIATIELTRRYLSRTDGNGMRDAERVLADETHVLGGLIASG